MRKMYTQHEAKEAMGDGGLLDRKRQGGGGEETEILQIRI